MPWHALTLNRAASLLDASIQGPGGELFFHLSRAGRFSEGRCRRRCSAFASRKMEQQEMSNYTDSPLIHLEEIDFQARFFQWLLVLPISEGLRRQISRTRPSFFEDLQIFGCCPIFGSKAGDLPCINWEGAKIWFDNLVSTAFHLAMYSKSHNFWQILILMHYWFYDFTIH